jgi:hypothetical protein
VSFLKTNGKKGTQLQQRKQTQLSRSVPQRQCRLSPVSDHHRTSRRYPSRHLLDSDSMSQDSQRNALQLMERPAVADPPPLFLLT